MPNFAHQAGEQNAEPAATPAALAFGLATLAGFAATAFFAGAAFAAAAGLALAAGLLALLAVFAILRAHAKVSTAREQHRRRRSRSLGRTW